MIIRDCKCMQFNGTPQPRCAVCKGTGNAPPTEGELDRIFINANQTLASKGDIDAMKTLVERGELWPITTKDP